MIVMGKGDVLEFKEGLSKSSQKKYYLLTILDLQANQIQNHFMGEKLATKFKNLAIKKNDSVELTFSIAMRTSFDGKNSWNIRLIDVNLSEIEI